MKHSKPQWMQQTQGFNMKRIWRPLFVSFTLVLFFSSCSTLKSDLTVRPGKQFELGGNQKGSFTVQVINKGDVPVTLIERKRNGQKVDLGLFGPGEQQSVRFSAGSAALINNTATKPARLSLTVTGDKNLGMEEKGGR